MQGLTECLLVFCCQIHIIYCCNHGNIVSVPISQIIAIGENATFECVGYGTFLYWFVNGINTRSMTSEEKQDNGVDIFHIQLAPCTQFSQLTVKGNCMNNNITVHCLLYGDDPVDGNTTSNNATLTVQDNSSIIKDINAIQTDIYSLLITWEIESVTNQNHSLFLNIHDSNETNLTIRLNPNQRSYLYTIDNNNNCVSYNITINTESDSMRGCIDSKSLIMFAKGRPAKAENVIIQKFGKTLEIIQFEVTTIDCQTSIPRGIEILLLNNARVISSGLIQWENVSSLISDNQYEVKWSHPLVDNTEYRVMIVSYSTGGRSFSDPFSLSTYDVKDINYRYTQYNTELCLQCVFTDNTQTRGCLILLLNTHTLQTITVKILTEKSDGRCITLLTSGNYQTLVYDWEHDDSVSTNPAITRDVGWIHIPARFQVPSSQENYSNTTDPSHTTYTTHTTRATIATKDELVLSFGSVIGCGLLLLLVLFIIITVIMVKMKHKQREGAKNNNDSCVALTDNSSKEGQQEYEEQEHINSGYRNMEKSNITILNNIEQEYDTHVYEKVN